VPVAYPACHCHRQNPLHDKFTVNPFQVSLAVRSLAVLTCECFKTCIMGMHVFSQDDLISIAQLDLDQHQNISSPQTEYNSLLSLCPYIKHLHPEPGLKKHFKMCFNAQPPHLSHSLDICEIQRPAIPYS
jgi:hypothetical protein